MRWFCLFILLATAPALAKVSRATLAAAKRGEQLYKDGRYAEAAKAFRQAYDAEPLPLFLFNAGRANEQAGEQAVARQAYQTLLARGDVEAPLRKKAEDRLRALGVGPTAPPTPVAPTPSPVPQAAGVPAAAPVDAVIETPDARSSAKTAAYALGGVSLAGAGVGVVLGLMANGARRSFSTAASAADKRSFEAQARGQALVADVGWVVFVGAAVAAAVVYLRAPAEAMPSMVGVSYDERTWRVAVGGTF